MKRYYRYLQSFREKETTEWTEKIDNLNRELTAKGQLLAKNEEILSLQRKYIAESEGLLWRICIAGATIAAYNNFSIFILSDLCMDKGILRT